MSTPFIYPESSIERILSLPPVDSGDWFREFGWYLHQRRMEILKEMTVGNSGFLLDIGCGEGMLRLLGKTNVIGTDTRIHGAVTVRASAEYLPFRGRSFGLVFAGEVIEHLEHPPLALREWARVLDVKGILILSTPNGSLVSVEGGHPEHKYILKPNEIKAAMSKEGLRIVSCKGIFTGLISGKRLFRLIGSVRIKTSLLRIPIPLKLSYDFFLKATKERE